MREKAGVVRLYAIMRMKEGVLTLDPSTISMTKQAARGHARYERITEHPLGLAKYVVTLDVVVVDGEHI